MYRSIHPFIHPFIIYTDIDQYTHIVYIYIYIYSYLLIYVNICTSHAHHSTQNISVLLHKYFMACGLEVNDATKWTNFSAGQCLGWTLAVLAPYPRLSSLVAECCTKSQARVWKRICPRSKKLFVSPKWLEEGSSVLQMVHGQWTSPCTLVNTHVPSLFVACWVLIT